VAAPVNAPTPRVARAVRAPPLPAPTPPRVHAHGDRVRPGAHERLGAADPAAHGLGAHALGAARAPASSTNGARCTTPTPPDALAAMAAPRATPLRSGSARRLPAPTPLGAAQAAHLAGCLALAPVRLHGAAALPRTLCHGAAPAALPAPLAVVGGERRERLGGNAPTRASRTTGLARGAPRGPVALERGRLPTTSGVAAGPSGPLRALLDATGSALADVGPVAALECWRLAHVARALGGSRGPARARDDRLTTPPPRRVDPGPSLDPQPAPLAVDVEDGHSGFHSGHPGN